LDHELVLYLQENPRMAENFAVDMKSSINWTVLELNGKHYTLMSIRFLTIFCGCHNDIDWVFSYIIFSLIVFKCRKILHCMKHIKCKHTYLYFGGPYARSNHYNSCMRSTILVESNALDNRGENVTCNIILIRGFLIFPVQNMFKRTKLADFR
jgi:hypothetical protein